MNYTKAQQEIVSWIMTDTKRGVAYYEDTRHGLTTFIHPDGSHALTIPNNVIVINVEKCVKLEKELITAAQEDAQLLQPTGNLVEQNKRILVEYKNRHGESIWFAKRLLDKYGKNIVLYQPKPLWPAAVVDPDLQVMVGGVCQVRRDTKNQ